MLDFIIDHFVTVAFAFSFLATGFVLWLHSGD